MSVSTSFQVCRLFNVYLVVLIQRDVHRCPFGFRVRHMSTAAYVNHAREQALHRLTTFRLLVDLLKTRMQQGDGSIVPAR